MSTDYSLYFDLYYYYLYLIPATNYIKYQLSVYPGHTFWCVLLRSYYKTYPSVGLEVYPVQISSTGRLLCNPALVPCYAAAGYLLKTIFQFIILMYVPCICYSLLSIPTNAQQIYIYIYIYITYILYIYV